MWKKNGDGFVFLKCGLSCHCSANLSKSTFVLHDKITNDQITSTLTDSVALQEQNAAELKSPDISVTPHCMSLNGTLSLFLTS